MLPDKSPTLSVVIRSIRGGRGGGACREPERKGRTWGHWTVHSVHFRDASAMVSAENTHASFPDSQAPSLCSHCPRKGLLVSDTTCQASPCSTTRTGRVWGCYLTFNSFLDQEEFSTTRQSAIVLGTKNSQPSLNIWDIISFSITGKSRHCKA